MTTPRTETTMLPDAFDHALDSMKGRPDVVSTKVSTIRTTPTLAIGGSRLYAIQTFRYTPIRTSPDEKPGRSVDTIFLEVYGSEGSHRLVLPNEVAEAIARQRESVGGKTRSKTAKRLAAERAERGEQPAFLKARRKKARR